MHWLFIVVITVAGSLDRVSCCFSSDAGLRWRSLVAGVVVWLLVAVGSRWFRGCVCVADCCG